MRQGLVTATIVVPVFNEEKTIRLFIEEVEKATPPERQIQVDFLFVNDGSKDQTIQVLRSVARSNPRVSFINLSRNFGKEAALTAGIDNAKGDVVIPMDVDLQDPPEMIEQMVSKWREGFDVVLAKRANRDSDRMSKRFFARAFYKINNGLTSTKIPEDVGDFRLLDKKVVLELRRLPESGRFMKGVFAWVGFESCVLEYTRNPRSFGETKFNGLTLTKLAVDGITNFSVAPLRLSVFSGLLFSLLGVGYGSFLVFRTIAFGDELPGYPSLMVTILFLGGVQLISLGVIGEYVGRTFLETKRRPVYVVQEFSPKLK